MGSNNVGYHQTGNGLGSRYIPAHIYSKALMHSSKRFIGLLRGEYRARNQSTDESHTESTIETGEGNARTVVTEDNQFRL